jgi:hypothetical protein
VSVPCRLEHIRRCTGSTRWWSLDWLSCHPRYPRFVHFSWSFPVNWYIQSIHYTLAIKSVTFVSAWLIHLRNCSLLSTISPYLLVAPIPHLKHVPIFIYRCFLPSPILFLVYLFSSVLLVDYLIIGTHDLYNPTFLFPSIHSFTISISVCPFLRCFQPFTTILYPSLPAPCDYFLPPFIKVLTTGYVSFRPICERCFGPPPSYSTFLSLPIVTCLFFSAPIFSSFYHYSRTGYEEKTTMRRLFLPKHNVRFWPRPLKQTGCRAIRARKYKALRVRTMACSPFI